MTDGEKLETEVYSENDIINNIGRLVNLLDESVIEPRSRLEIIEKIECCVQKLNDKKAEHDDIVRRMYHLNSGQRDSETCEHPSEQLFRVPGEPDGAYCSDCGKYLRGRTDVPFGTFVKFKRINLDLQ